MTGVMDCPMGGEAAVQPPDACLRAGADEMTEAAEEAGDFALEGDYWRHEVAARLQRYRARRKPRAPRYPSLLLPFDAPDARTRSLAASETPAAPLTQTH